MNSKIKNIIFDLDGTIIDPLEGITKSIQYAMEKLGKTPLSTEELLFCIGPPLYDTFPILLERDDKEFIWHAVDIYREYYNVKGIYQHELYDGIVDTLEKLKTEGYKVFIATSKPRVMADKIAEYRNIKHYFDGIYGCELDGTRSNKAELISYLLEKEKIQSVDSIMIGDRKYDIIGGIKNKLMTCGVSYGYGSVEELENADADIVINKPEELIEVLRK
jgi:phosphoglycolate phosphatase